MDVEQFESQKSIKWDEDFWKTRQTVTVTRRQEVAGQARRLAV